MIKFKSHLPFPFEHTQKEKDDLLKDFHKTLSKDEIGFFTTFENESLLTKTKDVFNKTKQFKNFIHIGIGGSCLGPEMLISAFPENNDTNFVFLNNTDPDDIFYKLKNINLDNSLIYVVSKSGGTAETIGILNYIISHYELDEEYIKNHIITCTTSGSGDLYEFSSEFGCKSLSVPKDVGGRFSILTPVGYLPALFAGIDVDELIKGAKEYQAELIRPDNQCMEIALDIFKLYNSGVTQTVLMPYSSLLRDLSFWFVQLWAESLGKNENFGLTPVPAYGATDQHSQVQLFMEGPNNKYMMLLEVENFVHKLPMSSKSNLKSFNKLSNYTVNQLIQAEFNGTLKALKNAGRPVLQITIPSRTPYYLGQLILFLETLTVYTAEMAGINAFNQPGVEAGKKYAFEYLES